MTPLVPLVGGLLAFAVAAMVLRSYGPRYRIGRLLATVPAISLAEALRVAEAGEPRYLRVEGRLDSEEPFEDEARRPLVFRRTRFQARVGNRWTTFDERRDDVPFEVGDGLRAIGVAGEALDEGLVVIPRESTGTAAELPDGVPAGLEPDVPVRAIVEQVSAVEHAIVLGVPVAGSDGSIRLTAGAGRPLILTTLETPEAMRVLGGGQRGRAFVVVISLLAGSALVVTAVGWLAMAAVTGRGW